MTTHRSSTHAALGIALVCLLASPAIAQDRMPPIPKDNWSPELQKAASTRGALVGPWIPLSRSPEVMGLMMDMRTHVASRSLLSNALTEMAILIAAREWTQQFEWSARARGDQGGGEARDYQRDQGRAPPAADERAGGGSL